MPAVAFYHKFTYKIPPGVLIGWPGTNASIPSGWTRETTVDARFVKMVATSATNPGGTGGGATHDHPFPVHTHTGTAHSHVGGTASASVNGTATGGGALGSGVSVPNHGHASASVTSSSVAAATSGSNSGPANYDTASSNPPYFEVIFIKSDGRQTFFPNTAIMFWNTATPPSNWRACDGASGAPDLRNRFLRGAAAAGDGGATGGSDTHSHSASHTHPSGGTHTHTPYLSSSSYSGSEGLNSGAAQSESRSHQHDDVFTAAGDPSSTAAPAFNSASGATATVDGQPPWKKLHAIQSNATNTRPVNGLIGMWLDTLASLPSPWKLCDGTNGTPNEVDKFVKAVNTTDEIGNTGGATTHTHGAGSAHAHPQQTHPHTWSGNSAVANSTTATHFQFPDPDTATFNANSNHYHTMSGSTNTDGAVNSGGVTVDASTSGSNLPTYTEVAYVQFTG